jgi:CheY-like chemotaxis protein
VSEGKKTILLADDERALRLLLRATLGTVAFRILEASDGEEALRLARQEHPDLVLLDIGMPGLDGYAVCRALKGGAATRGIHVVMLTARAQTGDREQGFAESADGYVTKPFSPAELLTTVEKLLGMR